jgi:hypothetical protein
MLKRDEVSVVSILRMDNFKKLFTNFSLTKLFDTHSVRNNRLFGLNLLYHFKMKNEFGGYRHPPISQRNIAGQEDRC